MRRFARPAVGRKEIGAAVAHDSGGMENEPVEVDEAALKEEAHIDVLRVVARFESLAHFQVDFIFRNGQAEVGLGAVVDSVRFRLTVDAFVARFDSDDEIGDTVFSHLILSSPILRVEFFGRDSDAALKFGGRVRLGASGACKRQRVDEELDAKDALEPEFRP